jgi:hypothetical protein
VGYIRLYGPYGNIDQPTHTHKTIHYDTLWEFPTNNSSYSTGTAVHVLVPVQLQYSCSYIYSRIPVPVLDSSTGRVHVPVYTCSTGTGTQGFASHVPLGTHAVAIPLDGLDYHYSSTFLLCSVFCTARTVLVVQPVSRTSYSCTGAQSALLCTRNSPTGACTAVLALWHRLQEVCGHACSQRPLASGVLRGLLIADGKGTAAATQ